MYMYWFESLVWTLHNHFISFYQIVTQIRTAYRITFPVAYVQLLSLFQIANGHAF